MRDQRQNETAYFSSTKVTFRNIGVIEEAVIDLSKAQAFLWAESISQQRFNLCTKPSGRNQTLLTGQHGGK